MYTLRQNETVSYLQIVVEYSSNTQSKNEMSLADTRGKALGYIEMLSNPIQFYFEKTVIPCPSFIKKLSFNYQKADQRTR